MSRRLIRNRRLIRKMHKRLRRTIRWSSHIPIHKAILNSFPITGILELGAGLNSTVEFFSHDKEVISIERDREWIKKLRTMIKEDEKHSIVHFDPCVDVDNGTLFGDVKEEVVNNAIEFYSKYISEKTNMLFIDNEACFRGKALLNLSVKFDVITYHDVEDSPVYNYDWFTNNNNYIWYMDKSFIAWTGLLIHPKYEQYIPEFMKQYCMAAEQFAVKHGVNFKNKLEKIYG